MSVVPIPPLIPGSSNLKTLEVTRADIATVSSTTMTTTTSVVSSTPFAVLPPTTDTTDSDHTLTAAVVLGGSVITSTYTGARNITLPTGSDLTAALPTDADQDGVTFSMLLFNDSGQNNVLTTNTNLTFFLATGASATVADGASAMLVFTRIDDTDWYVHIN